MTTTKTWVLSRRENEYKQDVYNYIITESVINVSNKTAQEMLFVWLVRYLSFIGTNFKNQFYFYRRYEMILCNINLDFVRKVHENHESYL